MATQTPSHQQYIIISILHRSIRHPMYGCHDIGLDTFSSPMQLWLVSYNQSVDPDLTPSSIVSLHIRFSYSAIVRIWHIGL